jgi:hypothetical protein
MTSKAARRRRAKHSGMTLPGGEVAAQPSSQGARKPKEDPMATVIAARMRRSGITDPAEARQPICGTDMGLCIRALSTGQDRADLENAWAALSAAHRNYMQRDIGLSASPQNAALPIISDRTETDSSLRVDLRTSEERDRAAKQAWVRWQRAIDAISVPNWKWALRGALWGFLGDGCLWRNMAPTTEGIAAVSYTHLTLPTNVP